MCPRQISALIRWLACAWAHRAEILSPVLGHADSNLACWINGRCVLMSGRVWGAVLYCFVLFCACFHLFLCLFSLVFVLVFTCFCACFHLFFSGSLRCNGRGGGLQAGSDDWKNLSSWMDFKSDGRDTPSVSTSPDDEDPMLCVLFVCHIIIHRFAPA